MGAPASVAGHPVHAMLIAFPVALFSVVLLLDLLFFLRGRDPFLARCSYLVLVLGVMGAAASAATGINDFKAYRLEALGTAATHLRVGLALTLLYVVLAALRWRKVDHIAPWMLVFSFAGMALVAYQGWLGGEMVYRQHVAIAALSEQGGGNSGSAGNATTAGAGGTGKGGASKAPALSPTQVNQALALFTSQGCDGCHALNGKGGAVGPDLTHEGRAKGQDWISTHILDPKVHTPGSSMPPFPASELPTPQRNLLAQYLASLK